METTFSPLTVQEAYTGVPKTQAVAAHSTPKASPTKTGHSPDPDQECKCPPCPMDQTIFTVQDHSTHGLTDLFWTTVGWWTWLISTLKLITWDKELPTILLTWSAWVSQGSELMLPNTFHLPTLLLSLPSLRPTWVALSLMISSLILRLLLVVKRISLCVKTILTIMVPALPI